VSVPVSVSGGSHGFIGDGDGNEYGDGVSDCGFGGIELWRNVGPGGGALVHSIVATPAQEVRT
jgi:hypothetical protein